MHKNVVFAAAGLIYAMLACPARAQVQSVSPLGSKVSNYVTATMEGAYAWYEQGVDPDGPLSGLPHAGITAADSSAHGTGGPTGTFLLQPFDANNVLLLNSAHSAGRLTLTTPTLGNAYWITCATAIGPAYLNTVTHFADGTPDFTQNYFSEPDWFRTTPNVYSAGGRIQILTNPVLTSDPGSFSAGGSSAPELAITTVVFSNPAVHPISSIDLSWVESATSAFYTSSTAVFGVSVSANGAAGPFNAVQLTPSSFNQDLVVEDAATPTASALPEPVGLMGLGLVGMMLRRRRSRVTRDRMAFTAEPLETRTLLSQTFFVTNFTDDPSTGGTTLRQAISFAANGDTVAFSNSPPNLQGNHVIVLASPIEVTTSFTLLGSGSGLVTVSGNQASRVFVIDPGAAPTFTGFSITQGNDTVDTFGGAVLINTGASLALSGVSISDSQANNGGAVANLGTLNVTNSSFTNNTGYGGGAIENLGAAKVTGSSFSNNSSAAGGAIENRSSDALLMIDRSTFTNNTSFREFDGSAACIANEFGTLILSNSSFYGNVSWGSFSVGGVGSSGTATISWCVFSGNTGNTSAISIRGAAAMTTVTDTVIDSNAGSAGTGTCAVSNGGTLNFVDSTISNNNSGGIQNSGTLRLINSTIAQNSVGSANLGNIAGGITNSGVVISRNSTIAKNFSASTVGGIYTTVPTVTLYNTIVAANTQQETIVNQFTVIVAGDISGTVGGSFNLIGNGGSGGLVSGVNFNMVGVVDPGLAPLGNYGGPTQTMALMPGSLAFNSGSIDQAVDQNGQTLLTDQRGSPRVASSSVDVGAYEAGGGMGIPAGLAAVAGVDEISLSWSAGTSNGPYAVYRGTSPGGEDATPYAATAVTSFVDRNTVDGVTYYYRVAAADAFGHGAYANEASALPTPVGPLTSGDGTSGLSLVRDQDGVHIDWSYGGHEGVFPVTDPNPITVVGNATLTYIGLGDTFGASLPKTLRLQGNFQFTDVDAFVFTRGYTIDIGEGTVYFSYGGNIADPASNLYGYLLNGYHNGAWDGIPFDSTAQFISSAVASGPAGKYSIGFADSADGAVAGQPANTVEVRFTVTGDANLDGVVNMADATRLQSYYGTTNVKQWDRADFNYDSAVDGSDALALGRNFNASVPALTPTIVAAAQTAAATVPVASAPKTSAASAPQATTSSSSKATTPITPTPPAPVQPDTSFDHDKDRHKKTHKRDR